MSPRVIAVIVESPRRDPLSRNLAAPPYPRNS
jgi:hypothetical protein